MTRHAASADGNVWKDRRRSMFEWGMFGWFALLSWAGVILIIIAMLMGNGD